MKKNIILVSASVGKPKSSVEQIKEIETIRAKNQDEMTKWILKKMEYMNEKIEGLPKPNSEENTK